MSKSHKTRDSLSSSSLQVVQIYLQPFRCNSLLKCVSQAEIAKNSRKTFFRGSRSFKVIDVDKSKKPVTSACNYAQHVCAHLQQFSV